MSKMDFWDKLLIVVIGLGWWPFFVGLSWCINQYVALTGGIQ